MDFIAFIRDATRFRREDQYLEEKWESMEFLMEFYKSHINKTSYKYFKVAE